MQATGSGKWAAAGYSWPQLYAILRHLLSFFLTEPRMTRIARIWFSRNRKDFLFFASIRVFRGQFIVRVDSWLIKTEPRIIRDRALNSQRLDLNFAGSAHSRCPPRTASVAAAVCFSGCFLPCGN